MGNQNAVYQEQQKQKQNGKVIDTTQTQLSSTILQSSSIFISNRPVLNYEIITQVQPNIKESIPAILMTESKQAFSHNAENIGQNQRTKVPFEDLQNFPYLSIGKVIGKYKNSNCLSGTGFLIHGNIVLTCAHNCYSRKDDIEVKEMKFIPRLYGNKGQSFKVKRIYYNPEFRDQQRTNDYSPYDYAILVLQKQISERYGYLVVNKDNREVKNVEVSGYPCIHEARNMMFRAHGKVIQKTQQVIFHNVPTSRGQSGSPITDGQGRVIGIHVGQANEMSLNIGIRLRQEIVREINQIIAFTEEGRRPLIKNIEEMKDYPLSCFGLVKLLLSQQLIIGNGVLIRSDLILTSARMCCLKLKDIVQKQIYFFAGGQRKTKIKSVFYPGEYLNDKNWQRMPQSNIAFMELEEEVGNEYGFLGLDMRPISSKSKVQMLQYEENAGKYNLKKVELKKYERNKNTITYEKVKKQNQTQGFLMKKQNQRFFIYGMEVENVKEEKKRIFIFDQEFKNMKSKLLQLYEFIKEMKANKKCQKIPDSNGYYQGQQKDGQMNGKGIEYLKDEEKYEGQYVNDKRNGKGTFYYSDGEKYEGNWKNNEPNGYGVQYFNNGDKYEGEWKNEKPNGEGVYLSYNGDIFKGDYENGSPNGEGKEYLSSGILYEGSWKDGQEDGKGIKEYVNGDKQECLYENGKIKSSILQTKSGQIYDCAYEKGQLVSKTKRQTQ